jgi:hypothetical protein
MIRKIGEAALRKDHAQNNKLKHDADRQGAITRAAPSAAIRRGPFHFALSPRHPYR